MPLWGHEASRVFRDRLINAEDTSWFDNLVVQMVNQRFDSDWTPQSLCKIVYIDFTDGACALAL